MTPDQRADLVALAHALAAAEGISYQEACQRIVDQITSDAPPLRRVWFA